MSTPAGHYCGYCNKDHSREPKLPNCRSQDTGFWRNGQRVHYCTGCPPATGGLPPNPPSHGKKGTPKKSGGDKKQASGEGSKQKQALEQSQDTKHDSVAESAANDVSGVGEHPELSVGGDDGPDDRVGVAVKEGKERRDSKSQIKAQTAAIEQDEADVEGELSGEEGKTER